MDFNAKRFLCHSQIFLRAPLTKPDILHRKFEKPVCLSKRDLDPINQSNDLTRKLAKCRDSYSESVYDGRYLRNVFFIFQIFTFFKAETFKVFVFMVEEFWQSFCRFAYNGLQPFLCVLCVEFMKTMQIAALWTKLVNHFPARTSEPWSLERWPARNIFFFGGGQNQWPLGDIPVNHLPWVIGKHNRDSSAFSHKNVYKTTKKVPQPFLSFFNLPLMSTSELNKL